MAVIIGSARADENGKATGGKAGDQTSKEITTQNWYLSDKGWVLLRPKDSTAATKIANNVKAACSNNKIGYDQGQRNTLYTEAQKVGFDCAKVTKECETDCSALVRVCCAYAGIMAADFTTDTQASKLMATGGFDKLTDTKYTKSPDYLRAGDILVTKSKGHTVVVLSDGSKAALASGEVGSSGGKYATLKQGMKGSDVILCQQRLLLHGHMLPEYGPDGEYGAETAAAVQVFQAEENLEVDGICGPQTWAALLKAPPERKSEVIVTGLSATVAQNLADELKCKGYTANVV